MFMDVAWMITRFALIDTAMVNLDHQTDVRAGVADVTQTIFKIVAETDCLCKMLMQQLLSVRMVIFSHA
jgi:hypothetical protein